MTAVICGGGIRLRRVMWCPVCERRRRFAALWAAWYGETVTCLGCGDTWTDGEMHERPFRRGWRDEERERARDRWAHAFSARDARRAIRAELDEVLAFEARLVNRETPQ